MTEPIPPTEAALRLELPTYNANAQTWFIQLDAIFQARHITSQQSKFAFVVEKLPVEVAAEVSGILTSLLPEKPYEVLRQTILQRTGCSEELSSALYIPSTKSPPLQRRPLPPHPHLPLLPLLLPSPKSLSVETSALLDNHILPATPPVLLPLNPLKCPLL
ncbi:unnamed protein product [Acanthosepion pharaonis]|uniref:DUF7041 domain-containing protein n=1 Tax=Acanthosepion pharaonis TaxID=158019 RepID=A0A812BFY0_ACAPH|nr:unnamed protein product [Sepia pharaonis]